MYWNRQRGGTVLGHGRRIPEVDNRRGKERGWWRGGLLREEHSIAT